jgi:hypothetical protein
MEYDKGISLPIHDLPAGLYYIELEMINQQFMRPFVVGR